MDKKDFIENTRYTVTLRQANGQLRPANIYVQRLFKDSMIIRQTDREGLLRKLAYADVLRIVSSKTVPKQDWYHVPDAILQESNWEDRSEIYHYSSAPHMGK